MDHRRELIVLGFLIILIAIVYSGMEFWRTNLNETNVKSLVLEDLKTKHPDTAVGIISMEKITEGNSTYYSIKAKVTKDYATPCPVRIHYYYSYPEQNFVTRPPEYITKNCKVCTDSTCYLMFEEEAIIASHTLKGTESISNYIDENKGAYPKVEPDPKGWKITWKSPSSEIGYEIILSFKGEVIDLKQIKTLY
ncbi:MAG: hypothetical protein WC501_01310 [Candidatus Micrarchaeia archaeon]